MRGVNDGIKFQDNEFKLFEYDTNNNVIEVTYKGAWFMVDNGYLSWSCTVPPIKDGVSYEHIRFSEWLESMRKDVECTFGIMKGRFCILRNGFRFHSIKKCDQTWLTCCALHNRLLFIDGLHENWDIGKLSNWGGKYYKSNKLTTPVALQRLHGQVKTTGFKLGTNTSADKYTVNGKRIVKKIPLSIFQDRLVEHFDIRFKKNDIVWPRRINTPAAI